MTNKIDYLFITALVIMPVILIYQSRFQKIKEVGFALKPIALKMKDSIIHPLAWTKVRVWNRGVKLAWHRLWVRNDEFHKSLDLDHEAMGQMSKEKRMKYLKDITQRRQISHERNLNKT